MHGAMAVEGIDDAEADFIGAVRGLVGPDSLISASYDLHGNLSAAIMESARSHQRLPHRAARRRPLKPAPAPLTCS